MIKPKNALTSEQKRLDVDLWIIILSSLAVFMLFAIFGEQISSFIEDSNIHILPRVLVSATFEYGLAGLGITIVCILRKESFLSYRLRFKGIVPTIALSVLCFVPYIIFLAVTKQLTGYAPLSVKTTPDVLAAGFPINVIGMLITGVSWGFFEGFNYVVISDKINKRYPSKNKWLNWGAIVCTVFCILIHGAIGITSEGFFEMLCVIFIIYGMLMVKEYTKNSWGCVFIFLFLWNAL